jgi:uncharacterized membrane protein YgcG
MACTVVFGVFPAYLACGIALSLAALAVTPVILLAGRLRGAVRKSPRAVRRAVGAIVIVAVAIVALLAWRVALAAAAGLAPALPAALSLACGAYTAALVFRDDPRPGRWADASLIITVAIGPAALVRPGIITDDPVAGLLFPMAAWLAVRLWRSMGGSGNRVVRASADVTAAVALGAIVDLLVVWTANIAGLRVLTVARACHLLHAVSAGNNPDWWYLAIPLLLLAAAYTARARWSGRLTAIGARARRGRAVRWAGELPGTGMLRPRLAVLAFSSSRRMMTFLHVGLLLVPLVCLTGPALAERSLLGPLRARYVIAYHADEKARAEVLAYRQLRREVAAASPGQRAAMKASIGNIASTADAGGLGAGQATPAQLASAGSLGQEEGAYLEYSGQAPARGEPSPPSLATGSLATAATQAEAEEAAAEEAEGYAEKAGASAAAAIGEMLSIPSGGMAVQILQEYLAGLTEESPVADALARLAGRLGAGDTDDPGAEQALDPGQAEKAATAGEISTAGGSGSQGSGNDSSNTGTGGGDGDGDGGGEEGGGSGGSAGGGDGG